MKKVSASKTQELLKRRQAPLETPTTRSAVMPLASAS